MSARKKAGAVYLAVAALVLASWIGNIFVYRGNQLPAGGFLRHYIEAPDSGGSFNLLYVANRQDNRQVASVFVEDVPGLRFYQPAIQTEMRYQKIYRIMAQIDPLGEKSEGEQDPIVIHSVKVQYTDGTSSREDIGEIRIFRQTAPSSGEKSPISSLSSSSSSDGTGTASMTVKRPVTLTGISSAWLPVLGNAFEWQANASGKKLDLPASLTAKQSLTVSYQFHLPEDNPLSMNVYELMLKMTFQEDSGKTYDGTLIAEHVPYPSEAEMHAYVRAQRREKA
ncbi:hypothetical protein [Cohnella zeiphila]|uniref:Uncharacterized protein n=1 Tax=Cohnella zeiphila TaxID=2761120 RepID=A0A7X0STG8_9BACL|nr:hypothetical protein [Cohnella zeiphila]MBB6733593.1 hypothetical protein [Cohnella zeiphila]